MHVLQAYPIEAATSIKLIHWLSEMFPTVSLSYYTQDSWLVDRASAEIDREVLFTGVVPICGFIRSCAASQNGIFKIMLIDLSENNWI